MKHLILLITIFSSFASQAQTPGMNVIPWFTNASNIDSTLCDWSTTDSVLVQPNYSTFHTQDNLWDGPIDSNYCLNNVDATINGLHIFGNEVDSTKPIFIESDLGVNGVQLIENTNYRFIMRVDDLSLYDTDCSDTSCTKLYLQIRKPDSSMTGDTVVVWELDVIETQSGFLYACFVTEKFSTQVLERFVVKVQPNNPGNIDTRIVSIEFEYPLDPWIHPVISNNNIASYYIGGQYEFFENFWETQYIALHDQPGYPSDSNIHYIDLQPVPNTATPENVDVIIHPNVHLAFQPFVEFRGGEVSGGGDYHTYTINNMGSEICLMPFVEIKINDGNIYRHGDGTVYFGGGASCMLFDEGGALEVATGATFSYGQSGVGMMGLHSNGEIRLESNAVLVLNNMVVLADDQDEYSEGVHVYMEPGSRLIFEEGSHLKDWSKNGTMRLIVHMNRSWVDASRLKPAERELIQYVYDEEEISTLYLNVYDHPISSNEVTFEFMSRGEGVGQVVLVNSEGKIVYDGSVTTVEGMNAHTIALDQFKSGAYVLKLILEESSDNITVIRL